MESERKKVTIKVTYNQLGTSLKGFIEKVITTDRESFNHIDDKEKLVAFLKTNFKLGELKNLKILRKSKKHKDYIPLETDNDFKSLARSLKVKNHIKLLLNDSTPAGNHYQRESDDYRKGKSIDFASLGKALVEASLTVLSDFRGEEFQARTQKDSEPLYKAQPSERANASPYKDCIHELVACDSCNPVNFVPIKGVRFKCLVCPDYDLCEQCEAKQHVEEKVDGEHSFTHSMIKITRPLNKWNSPRTFSSKNDDIIYDIPLDHCSLTNKVKIESILREGNLDEFFRNVDKIIEESDKYRVLTTFLKNDGQEEDEDTKFAMLQSIIECSNRELTNGNVDETSEKYDKGIRSTDEIETSTDEDETYNDTLALIDKDDNTFSNNDSNKVLVFTKKYAPDARVISLILYNNSPYFISGGDLKFEFYDEQDNESILVKNVRSIASGEKRSYNLGILTEKFNSLSKRKLRISTSNDIIMDGVYCPGELTSLNITNKPFLAGPIDKKLKNDLIEVVLVPKSSSMAQVILTNKATTELDCSNLKFKVVNCFDQIVCDLSVIHGRKILPKRTAKYNIGLSNAHLKYPFKLIISTESFLASCDLSLKHLSGIFEVIPKEKSDYIAVEDSRTLFPVIPSSIHDSQATEDGKLVTSEKNTSDVTEHSTSMSEKSTEGSTHFVVLPSLPKESVSESKNLSSSEYADAKSYLVHESSFSTDKNERGKANDDDYDIISINEDGEEITSDFEVLSPASSH